MNRADFLKRLGLGAIGVAIAPKVIGDIKEAPLKPKPSNLVVYPVADNIEIDGTFTINDYNATTLEPDWDITEDKLERAYMMQKEIDNEIFLGKTMG